MGLARSSQTFDWTRAGLLFLPEKKILARENFQYFAREFFKVAEKKILETAREKKCAREKNCKILPEKQKKPSREKMKNSARENSKSTREKIRYIFFMLLMPLAGLCYGDFFSICLMLSSRLYYRYFGKILFAPATSLKYYDRG